MGPMLSQLLLFVTLGFMYWAGIKLLLEGVTLFGSHVQIEAGLGLSGAERMIVSIFCISFIGFGMGMAAQDATDMPQAKKFACKAFDLLDTESVISGSAGNSQPSSCVGKIQFEGVRFAYPNRLDSTVYADLTVEMEAGKTTALVGASGCGKSTAVQLIERFYDPLGGRVLLDGVDLKTLDLGWLRRQIGLVGQEPVLFSGTIVENIMMGKHGSTREEAVAAAKMANAHAFIEEFEKGYDTDVGGSGGQLSGGQKQRVAIARAIIKDPSILLLDEATSALDNESERVVQAALDDLMARHRRTTVVIAHRLTTIRNADKIVVLSKGAVAEQGTHDELMENKSTYFDLVEASKAKESGNDTAAATESAAGVETNLSAGEKFELGAPERSASVQIIRAMSATDVQQDKQSESTGKKKSLTKEEKAAAKKQKQDEAAQLKVVVSRLQSMKDEEDKPLALVGVIGAVVGGALTPFVGYVFVRSINMFFLEEASDVMREAVKWGLVMLAAAVVQRLGEMGRSIGFGRTGAKITSKLRSQVFDKLVRMDIPFFDTNAASAHVTMLANEIPLVQALVGEQMGQMCLVASTLIVGLFWAFFVGSWLMALLMFCALPVIILGMAVEMAVLTQSGTKESGTDIGNKGSTIVGEVVRSVRTVASFSLETPFGAAYRSAVDEHVRLSRPAKLKQAMGPMLSQLLLFVTFGFMYWAGIKLLLEGVTLFGSHLQIEAGLGLSVAERMIVSIFCIFFIGFGMGMAAQDATDMPQAKKFACKAFDLLDTESVISASAGNSQPSSCVGKIQFEGVRFAYPNRLDSIVYADLTVEMEAGKTTALVGASGCGKSTAVQLIERFYDPLGGRVLLDGVDLKTLDLGWLRRQIGLVGQEPVLFSGTIVENIMM